MSRFESFLTKIQDLIKDYCEFRNICPDFDPNSHTCTIAGGLQCESHRNLKTEKENRHQKRIKLANFTLVVAI
jgi:hypothetical protein